MRSIGIVSQRSYMPLCCRLIRSSYLRLLLQLGLADSSLMTLPKGEDDCILRNDEIWLTPSKFCYFINVHRSLVSFFSTRSAAPKKWSWDSISLRSWEARTHWSGWHPLSVFPAHCTDFRSSTPTLPDWFGVQLIDHNCNDTVVWVSCVKAEWLMLPLIHSGHGTSRNFAAMLSNEQQPYMTSQGGKSTMMNHFAGTRRQRNAHPVLVGFIVLSLATACYCGVIADMPSIDVNDYFQLPADMVEHFPLIHNVEHIKQSTSFAHIVKEADSWTAHSARRRVTIPTTSTNLSFFYHNLETGTITKVQNTYETVADTVYLEHIPSALHVVCDSNSSLTITFNASYPFPSRGLKFGLKRGHYLKFTKVSGGHSFFCNSSCIMGNVIARNVLDVLSYSEDTATGLLTSITLETSPAPQETMYQTVADYFINGTFALIPKALLRTQSNSSRLSWHAYLKKVHHMKEDFKVRSAAKLRAATCVEGDVLCYEIGLSGIEVRYKKSEFFGICCQHLIIFF